MSAVGLPPATRRRGGSRLALLFLAGLSVGPALSATPETELPDVFSLSLEELTALPVNPPASLTRLRSAQAPAAVTTVTARDIELTPARNLYDLLEIYVPGAIWLGHELGPHPGLRGSVVNRNYKFILRVDGRLMNSKAHFGAKSELEQWELDDIARIDVVRGPGSVTYGPGAVAGVIDITTFRGRDRVGTRLSLRGNETYRSAGFSLSHGVDRERFSGFAFLSMARTEGLDSTRQFLVTKRNEAGFVGGSAFPDDEAMPYFADDRDRPQIKLHLRGDWANGWSGWLRYTQQGSTWRGNEIRASTADGELIDQQGVRDSQWTAAMDHRRPLRESLVLKSSFSLDSFNAKRRSGELRNPDPNHPLNTPTAYSETELFASTQLNWTPSERVEIAFGTEASLDWFGAPWGEGADRLRLGEDGQIISGPDSLALRPGAKGSADADGAPVFVGSGWSTTTFSFFSEANLQVGRRDRLLISARGDKNSRSHWLWSPRVAWIHELQERHDLRLILQRSQRINTADQVLVEDRAGLQPEPESLTALELLYSWDLPQSGGLDFSAFWNDGEIIAWNSDVDQTTLVGDLELWGIELEGRWEGQRSSWSGSYSLVQQASWKLAPGVPLSGVSYADYDQPLDSGARITGFGNDLANWPNQALKAVWRLQPTPRWALHADLRAFWDYQGNKDGFEALRRAVADTEDEADLERSLAVLASEDVFSSEVRASISASYRLSGGATLQLRVQNLVGTGGNKRYAYAGGTDDPAPQKIRFVEEPRAWTLRLTMPLGRRR